ncbi:hypothetical protein SNEBB_001353 [Seison nebaliae]|nr:hypothetical protein SNEBB_001353 [Seison nebaliae]
MKNNLIGNFFRRAFSQTSYLQYYRPGRIPGKYLLNKGFQPKYYQGGPLPRPKSNTPLLLPPYIANDAWSKNKVIFGQNDYIDILGNPEWNIRLDSLIKAPPWLRGFKGNEMERITRRLNYERGILAAQRPNLLFSLLRRKRFLYRKFNHKFLGKKT